MFCRECDAEINDKAIICVKCGCYTDNKKDESIVTIIKERKSLTISYVLWFFLGYFGIHRFYLGKALSGVIMLICSLISVVMAFLIIPPLIMLVWWIVDAFLIPIMAKEKTEKDEKKSEIVDKIYSYDFKMPLIVGISCILLNTLLQIIDNNSTSILLLNVIFIAFATAGGIVAFESIRNKIQNIIPLSAVIVIITVLCISITMVLTYDRSYTLRFTITGLFAYPMIIGLFGLLQSIKKEIQQILIPSLFVISLILVFITSNIDIPTIHMVLNILMKICFIMVILLSFLNSQKVTSIAIGLMIFAILIIVINNGFLTNLIISKASTHTEIEQNLFVINLFYRLAMTILSAGSCLLLFKLAEKRVSN